MIVVLRENENQSDILSPTLCRGLSWLQDTIQQVGESVGASKCLEALVHNNISM